MSEIFSSLGGKIAGALVAVMAMFGFVPEQAQQPIQEQTFGVALPSAVAVFETSLASPITSSAVSMTLTANSVRGGSTLTGYNCFTVDEGRTDAEFICGTVSGTAVSSLERGIDPFTGTSTNATLQFAHRRGSVVKITDFPIIQRIRNQANGVETFPNLMSYADTVLISVGSPTTTLATKYYVDNVAVAGASNADTSTKGIVEIATAEEAKRSTALGSTGAVLALPSSLATTTRNALTASGTIPVTDSTGYISKDFTNYADPTGFTIGTLTATNTMTISGTLNIQGSTTLATTSFSGAILGHNVGDGSDGNLSITSGTTTVDLGGRAVFVKNYLNLSITSTGHLAFSNPSANGTAIILNVQGTTTLTCSVAPCIDVSGMGSDGPTGSSCNNSNTGGTAGTISRQYILQVPGGGGGAVAFSASVSTVNLLGGPTTITYPDLFTGTGGQAGECESVAGGAAATSGDGGDGGGHLTLNTTYLNFTTTGGIMARGLPGTNASGGHASFAAAGGGGGGGGGWVRIVWDRLIAAITGTILVEGAVGGNSTSLCGTTPDNGDGGVGYSGTAGNGAAACPGTGGTGAAGTSTAAQRYK